MSQQTDTITAGNLMDTIGVFCGYFHNAAVGLTYVDHGADWIEYRIGWKPELVADPGSDRISSSVIYSALDASCALLPYVVTGRMIPAPTLELRVDHFRLPQPRKDLIFRGMSLKLDDNISFTRAIAHEGDPDDPVAIANGTFMPVDAL
jgi:acyl-coenzyme A thioesterase PaaI-like protein